MNPRRIFLALGIAVPACLVLSALAQKRPAQVLTKLDSKRQLGTPKRFRNLTLIPVYNSTARSSNAYITLDEGLKAKVVQVKESRGGGSVNTLYVTNNSDKPLYLMAGEVVLGGQQDRCLGKDIIILPRKRPIPIAVFCVEHGRWTGREHFAESAKMVASAGIRGDAMKGVFDSERPALTVRIAGRARAGDSAGAQVLAQRGEPAALGEAQQKVWAKVEEKNRRFNASPSTGTYKEVLNMSGGDTGKTVGPYITALSGAAERNPHLVGMVAAVNGKVTAADIFGDPGLFRKLWPKLLRSYAADAAENVSKGDKQVQTVTPTDARSFIVAAADAKAKAENRSDVANTLRLESKDAYMYRLMPGRAGGGGGLGGAALHESVIRK